MKIAIKEVGKKLQVIETNIKYRYECCKQFTGKSDPVEFIKLNKDGTFSLGVNENGLPLELPVNFLIGTNNPYYPIQKIVGTVVFVRCKYVDVLKKEIWDYEVEDLTEEDINYIEEMLNEKYQKELEKRFEDYGKGCFIWKSF